MRPRSNTLSEKQLRTLLKRAHKGDPQARTLLVGIVLPFVRRMAKKFARGRRDLAEDLASDGVLGFFDALERCNPARKPDFMAYAGRCMVSQIRRQALIDASPMTGAISANGHGRSTMRAFHAALGEGMSRAQAIAAAAKATGRSEDNTRTRIEHNYQTFGRVSFEQPTRADSTHSVADTLADGSPKPDDLVADEEMRTKVRRVLDSLHLSDADRVLVQSRFMDDASLKEVGDHLGVAREEVRQREVALLPRLRERLAIEFGMPIVPAQQQATLPDDSDVLGGKEDENLSVLVNMRFGAQERRDLEYIAGLEGLSAATWVRREIRIHHRRLSASPHKANDKSATLWRLSAERRAPGAGPKLTVLFTVRVSPEDRKRLDRVAEVACLTMSEWVRQKIQERMMVRAVPPARAANDRAGAP